MSMVLAAGNAAYARSGGYALGGPSGSGGRGYSPPLHGPGSSHNPIVKRSLHGPGSSHNPIVIRRRGRYWPLNRVARRLTGTQLWPVRNSRLQPWWNPCGVQLP